MMSVSVYNQQWQKFVELGGGEDSGGAEIAWCIPQRPNLFCKIIELHIETVHLL